MSEPHTILAVSMAKELKPCPFCGSEGEHLFHDVPLTKWKHRIVCVSTTCGMDGPVEATRFDAISAWNLTLEAFGKLFKPAVDKSTVLRWENGKLPVRRILEIEKVTGIDRRMLAPKMFKGLEAAE